MAGFLNTLRRSRLARPWVVAAAVLLFAGGLLIALLLAPGQAPPPRILDIDVSAPLASGKRLLTVTAGNFTPGTRLSLTYDFSNRTALVASMPAFGYLQDLVLKGRYAFLANGYRGLQAVDLSNARAPRIVGSVNPGGKSWDVALEGATAFVTVPPLNRLNLVDVSRPRQMRPIASIDLPGKPAGVTVRNGLVFVAALAGGLQIVDARSPGRPERIAEFRLPGAFMQDVTVAGDYAYVAAGRKGVLVIDIADPDRPRLTTTIAVPGVASSVTVAEDLCYVAAKDAGLQIYDIKIPADPHRLAALSTAGMAYKVTVRGNRAFVAGMAHGLEIIAVDNPGRPRHIATVGSPGSACAVALAENLAYLADGAHGLQIIDLDRRLSDATPPHLAFDYIQSIDVTGDIGLLGAGTSGMAIADLSSAAPRLLTLVDTPGKVYDQVRHGDFAYLADGQGGVLVADIGDPAHPLLVGGSLQGTDTRTVTVYKNHLLATDFYGNLRILRLDAPRRPRLVATLQLPGTPLGLSIADRFAFVACGDAGLQIIDLRDLQHPGIVGNLAIPWPERDDPQIKAEEVAARGGLAFLGLGREGLLALDVSRPEKPRVITRWRHLKKPVAMVYTDRRLYVSDLKSGVHVFDTRDPEEPIEIGLVKTPGATRGLAVRAGHVYTTNERAGLAVFPEPVVFDRPQQVGTNRLQIEIPPNDVQGDYVLRVFNEAGFAERPVRIP